jgi:hypothetical protein
MAVKAEYREGTLGWWLLQAGWTPVEVACRAGGDHKKDPHGRCEKCHTFPHPLWRYDEFDKRLTGWEARRLELLRIHNEFKSKSKGASA